jgi:phosphatidylinositol alpha-1,6-mannosyltransferase
MITSGLFVPHLRQALGPGVRFTTTIFGELIERAELITANAEFYRQILEQSDQVLATSAYCAGLARVVGYDPARVEVIYIGVDCERFAPEVAGPRAAALGLPPGTPRVLFLGRFHEEMGLDAVLDAIPLVVAQRPETSMLLVGARGPLSERAEAVARQFPANVSISQNVPFDAIPGYYAASDILLAPTRDRHACMGVSIKEAMAAGKAIIASNSGGIPEAIRDGEHGVILPFDDHDRLDPARLANAIAALLADPERRRRLGDSARRRAAEVFDNSVCLARQLAVVQRLIGKPEEPAP